MNASINSLHHQENDWLRELDFYDLEADILLKRLHEFTPFLAGDNKKRIEGFIAAFEQIKQQCAKLTKENKDRYDMLNQLAKEDLENIETEFIEDNSGMHKKIQDLIALVSKTRNALNAFIIRGK